MWDEELPLLMLTYQSSVQESTRFTLHHAHEKHTMSMLHIYGSGWKELSCGSGSLKSSSATAEQCYDRKTSGGQCKEGDSVWLFSPAVSRRQAAKFHRPWRGPYRVVKVFTGVMYCILIAFPNRQDC